MLKLSQKVYIDENIREGETLQDTLIRIKAEKEAFFSAVIYSLRAFMKENNISKASVGIANEAGIKRHYVYNFFLLSKAQQNKIRKFLKECGINKKGIKEVEFINAIWF